MKGGFLSEYLRMKHSGTPLAAQLTQDEEGAMEDMMIMTFLTMVVSKDLDHKSYVLHRLFTSHEEAITLASKNMISYKPFTGDLLVVDDKGNKTLSLPRIREYIGDTFPDFDVDLMNNLDVAEFDDNAGETNYIDDLTADTVLKALQSPSGPGLLKSMKTKKDIQTLGSERMLISFFGKMLKYPHRAQTWIMLRLFGSARMANQIYNLSPHDYVALINGIESKYSLSNGEERTPLTEESEITKYQHLDASSNQILMMNMPTVIRFIKMAGLSKLMSKIVQ